MPSEENIREQILELTRAYYKKSYRTPDISFIPGETQISYAGRVFDENEMVNLVDASLDFWLTHGRYARKFEREFANYLGVQYALLVNSGSSANLLAFTALTSPLLEKRKIDRGDEVITVAAGFPTTITPIIQYGAVPVFVDIDIETLNIHTSLLSVALSSRTKAVMIAHTLGNPFDVKVVKEFCDEHNLWLIEDNCDALGATVDGKLTGTWGDIGTSSFYPAHHITMGEGGACYTNERLLKKILLSIRDWGRDCWCEGGKDNTCGRRFSGQFGSLPYGYDHKYVYSHFGYNLKATEMQAAVGCAQLDKLSFFIQKRRDNFLILYEKLKDFQNYFVFPKATPGSEPSWFGFFLIVRDGSGISRNQLVEHLETRGIQTRNLFCGNIVRQPLFDTLKLDKDYRIVGTLKNTDMIMNNGFWVGVHPGMNNEMLNYIADSIREFLG